MLLGGAAASDVYALTLIIKAPGDDAFLKVSLSMWASHRVKQTPPVCSSSGVEGSAFGGKGPGLLLMEEQAPEGFYRM